MKVGGNLIATCFHTGFLLGLFLDTEDWRQYVPLKCQSTFNGLQDFTFWKTIFLCVSPIIQHYEILN
jgi:hypothetical protein